MPPKKRKDDTDVEVEKKKRKRKPKDTGASNGDQHEDDSDSQVVLEGSMLNGEVLICGGTNWDLIGRSQVPKGVKNIGGPNLWGPHRLAALKGVQIRSIISGCIACHSVIITTEGKAYTWGRNDKAQLGHGDSERRDIPTIVESLAELNIVDASCGKSHTLFLSDKGRVYAVGENKMGQLGLGTQSPSVPSPTRIQYKGPPIRKVAAGMEFSTIVDVRGNVYTFGSPEYGQLGHNTDGKYFVTSSKLTYSCEMKPRRVHVFTEKGRDGHVNPVNDVEVVDVACGQNHTIVVDRQKRAFTWGFGGYGRLGHNEQKDEWVPRMLSMFVGSNRGVASVFTGSTFTMAVGELGGLYLWGKNKQTGEATMYPKPVLDLNGWNVRSVGCCNKSIVVAADESLVSWGCSPTYGELGFGDNKAKSSPQPQEVKSVDGIFIHKVACGFGHTLLLAKNDTEEQKAKLEDLPDFEP